MSEVKWRTEKIQILHEIQKNFVGFFKTIEDVDLRMRYKQHFNEISLIVFDDSATDDKLSEAIESFGILVYCGGQEYMRLGGCLISSFIRIISFPSAPSTLKRMTLEGLANICWLHYENQLEFINAKGGKVLMRKISERENSVLCRWSCYLLVVLLAGGAKIIQEFRSIPLFRQILLATAEDHFIWNAKGWPCNHAELAFRILFGYFPDPFSSSNLITFPGYDRQADQATLPDGSMMRSYDLDESFRNITPLQALQMIIDYNTAMMKVLLQQAQSSPTVNTEIIQVMGAVQAQAHLLHTIQASMTLTMRQVEELASRASAPQSKRTSTASTGTTIFPSEVTSISSQKLRTIQHSRRSALHPKHMPQSFQMTMRRSRDSEDISSNFLRPRTGGNIQRIPDDDSSFTESD